MQVFPSEELPLLSTGKEKERKKGTWPHFGCFVLFMMLPRASSTPPSPQLLETAAAEEKKKKGFHKHMKTLTASRERLGLKLSWKVPSRWAALSKGSLGMSASGGVELLCFQY